MVLVALLAHYVAVPVIAAGGFSDGAGLAAALMLGAEGISMGTRFALSVESPIHPRRARSVVGIVAVGHDRHRPDRRTAVACPAHRLGAGDRRLPRLCRRAVNRGAVTRSPALRLGDLERGVVAIGQVVGAIATRSTCAEIIQRAVSRCAVRHRAPRRASSSHRLEQRLVRMLGQLGERLRPARRRSGRPSSASGASASRSKS